MSAFARSKSRTVITAALANARDKGLAGAALERFIAEQCPFRHGEQHNLRIWQDELRLALEIAKPKATGIPPMSLFDREGVDA